MLWAGATAVVQRNPARAVPAVWAGGARAPGHTANARVYAGIYRAIVEHRLAPGTRLREAEAWDCQVVSVGGRKRGEKDLATRIFGKDGWVSLGDVGKGGDGAFGCFGKDGGGAFRAEGTPAAAAGGG